MHYIIYNIKHTICKIQNKTHNVQPSNIYNIQYAHGNLETSESSAKAGAAEKAVAAVARAPAAPLQATRKGAALKRAFRF